MSSCCLCSCHDAHSFEGCRQARVAFAAMREALRQTQRVIQDILTDSQLDERVPCGQTIRTYSATVDAALALADKVTT